MNRYPPANTTRRDWLRATFTAIAAGTLHGAGCVPGGADLVVVTDWPGSELSELKSALAPSRLAWVRPTAGHDPTRLVSRGLPADVVLGGPIAGYRRLDAEGRLAPGDGQHWRLARSSPLGVAVASGSEDTQPIEAPQSWRDLGEPEWSDRIAIDDPRTDPVALAIAEARLAEGPWPEAYAELVRAAGRARLVVGSALTELSRGLVDVATTTARRVAGRNGLRFVPWPDSGDWQEGVAVLASTRNPELATRLVRIITERAGPLAAPSRIAADPASSTLLSDLLGATLIEAQPELRKALMTLEKSDHPEAADAAVWLVQAPPWPPASIRVLKERPDAEILLEALIDQLATDPEIRGWLASIWDHPEAPIDGDRLAEIAGAVKGRLAGEPRFREWLRGEWAAWARQRYRRVERLASGRFHRS